MKLSNQNIYNLRGCQCLWGVQIISVEVRTPPPENLCLQITKRQQKHWEHIRNLSQIYRKPPNIIPGLILICKHFLMGLHGGHLDTDIIWC
jgi:hypothetical protein